MKNSQNKRNFVYEDVVQNSPLCIKVFGKDGTLQFMNMSGRAEHSVKAKDDIQKWDWMGTVGEEDRASVQKAFQDALKGKSSRIEYRHSPEGSNHEWCWGIISPIKDADGSVKNVLFYSLDISARKQAEKELADMNKIMVDRELKMVELKETIKNLESKLTTKQSAE